MSLVIDISINREKYTDVITVQNITKKKGKMDTYRVIVNHGEDLFTVKHKRSEGARKLAQIVVSKLKEGETWN